ncbi:unnamed protein product, partial [Ixodes persulcatus]
MAPPLLLSLGLLFLMPVLGDGPFWTDIMGTEIQLCERAWWSNLLFINNFWQSKEMCLVATWYLACNFQFFIISVFIIIPLYKAWPPMITFGSSTFLSASVSNSLGSFRSSFSPSRNALRNPLRYQELYSQGHRRAGAVVASLLRRAKRRGKRGLYRQLPMRTASSSASCIGGTRNVREERRFLSSPPPPSLPSALSPLAWRCLRSPVSLKPCSTAKATGERAYPNLFKKSERRNRRERLGFLAFLSYSTCRLLPRHSRLFSFIFYSKFKTEKIYLFQFSFDIIMLTETWYATETEVLQMPLYSSYVLNRTSRRGGGVGKKKIIKGPPRKRPRLGEAQERARASGARSESPPRNQEISNTSWEDQVNKSKVNIDAVANEIFPYVVEGSSELDVSVDCMTALLKTFKAFRDLKGWAVRLMDASGKLPEGLLEGRMASIGSYDECMDLVAEYKTKELYRGKYCTVMLSSGHDVQEMFNNESDAAAHLSTLLRHPKRMTKIVYRVAAASRKFRLGICVPSVCSLEDVQNVVAHTSAKSIGARTQVTRCEVKLAAHVSGLQGFLIFSLCLLVCLVLVATVLDVRSEDNSQKALPGAGCLTNCLLSFSFTRNLNRLTSPQEPEALGAAQGVQAISMAWLICGHTYFLTENTHMFS